jgi:hypothetical protein
MGAVKDEQVAWRRPIITRETMKTKLTTMVTRRGRSFGEGGRESGKMRG